MEKYIGKSFEDLDSQEMLNISGGAGTTITTTSAASTTSSVPCGFASAGLTCITVLATVTVYIWTH